MGIKPNKGMVLDYIRGNPFCTFEKLKYELGRDCLNMDVSSVLDELVKEHKIAVKYESKESFLYPV